MAVNYADYSVFPRTNQICSSFLHAVHQNTVDDKQSIEVSVDSGVMTTPEIRIWVSADAPDPQYNGTKPDWTMDKGDMSSWKYDATVSKHEVIWVCHGSKDARIQGVRLAKK